MSSFSNPAQILANALAKAEGYGIPGAIPTQANNPGDLELGDLGYGTIQAQGGNPITVFPDAASGMTALQAQAQAILTGSSKYYGPDQTLSDIGTTYAGPGEGQTWAGNVASILGTSPDTPVGQIPALQSPQSAIPSLPLTVPTLTDPTGNTGIYSQVSPSAVLAPTNPGAMASSNSTDVFASNIGRVVFGLLGMVLIAAGVFSFKTSQLVVQTGGRIGKRVAEVAAT
jgi:hypothetical protein